MNPDGRADRMLEPADVEAFLVLVDKLRARGARLIRAFGIEVVFEGPASRAGDEKDPQAEHENQARKKAAKRTLEDRLLRPLGIKKDDAA